MSRTKSYYDLREALGLPGCPICRLDAEAIERYLDGLIYERVNDPGLRARIRQARGFCHEHAWALVRHGAALGTAIIMRDVLRDVRRSVQQAGLKDTSYSVADRFQNFWQPGHSQSSSQPLVTAISPRAPCVACAHLAELNKMLAAVLSEHLLAPEGFFELFQESDGLCLPHLTEVLAQVKGEAQRTALVQAQEGIWARLEHQLNELIRKSDYRFSTEPLGPEGVSWLRALAAISGERPGFPIRAQSNVAEE